MKKSYALLIFFFTGTMQADPISDAIRASDVAKVRLLVSERTLTEKQIIKYLDTADEIIRVRRDNLTLSQLHPAAGCPVGPAVYRSDRPSYREIVSRLLSLGCFIAFPFVVTGIYSRFISCTKESAEIFCIRFFSLYGVVSFIALINAAIDDFYRIRTLYADSITIKELFYDLL